MPRRGRRLHGGGTHRPLAVRRPAEQPAGLAQPWLRLVPRGRSGGRGRGVLPGVEARADAGECAFQPGADRGALGRQVQGHRALRPSSGTSTGLSRTPRRGSRLASVQRRPSDARAPPGRQARRGPVPGILRDEVVTMPAMTMVQAINNALREEMRRDDRGIVLGGDVGRNGGGVRCTEGLVDEFPDRVFDTPLAEGGIIGTAIGMALYGLRPVPEIQFMDFIYPGFDQIVSEAAKMRYRSGGQFSVPMTIRTPFGGGIRGGHYHSQSTEAYFCHTPGLKVVVPSTPKEAKGLLTSSGRAVVVYEAPRTGGYGAEISAILAEKAIEYLRGPIVRVTGFDTPFPYTLEDVYLPNADRVLAAIDKVMAF